MTAVNAVLKYDHLDDGNFRIYFRDRSQRYCWIGFGGCWSFMICSRDGEPSHEVGAKYFIFTLPKKKTDENILVTELRSRLQDLHAVTRKDAV